MNETVMLVVFVVFIMVLTAYGFLKTYRRQQEDKRREVDDGKI